MLLITIYWIVDATYVKTNKAYRIHYIVDEWAYYKDYNAYEYRLGKLYRSNFANTTIIEEVYLDLENYLPKDTKYDEYMITMHSTQHSTAGYTCSIAFLNKFILYF